MDTEHFALFGVILAMGYVYYRHKKEKKLDAGKLYLPFMVEEFPYDGPVTQLTGIAHANSKL